MKLGLCLTMLVLTASNQGSASEMKFKRIEILESNGISTTLQIFKGRKMFLSSRGENSNCRSSGIEAALNSRIRYTVHCENDPIGDKGMKSSSFATYDGHTIKIDSRSETKEKVFFTHSWTISIIGESCTGGVHIESTFGTFDKSIASCKVHY